MPKELIADCTPIVDDETGDITYAAATERTYSVTLADRKIAATDAIRSERWTREESGTTVNGLPIKTDDESQRKIAGAVQLFDKDPTLTAIDFEAQPGVWVTLNKAQMEAIGVAAGRHVQACFTQSKALMTAVSAAGTHAALDAIDIGAGWP